MPKVTKDSEAFAHIRGRLEGDVGGILKLVDTKALHVPFWSLVRMLFPAAEATADLMHHRTATGTSDGLVNLLRSELETVRKGYASIAATLTLLYRHSLTHQDEMRMLKSAGREVMWQIDYNIGRHLSVTANTKTNFTVEFDCRAFYEDLVNVLKTAEGGAWGGP